MIKRFSAYGFLKNQRYFEPFIILAYRDILKTAGAEYMYTWIGVLITFRVVCVNIMEIPSGALADLFGRRRVMITSLASYVLSFIVFGIAFRIGAAGSGVDAHWILPLLFFAEFLFSIGESFRTGTHKSIIFDWLRRNGRLSEKTKVYGTTRSWSKLGSALAGIISVVIMITLREYKWLFWLSAIMSTACLINLATYPKELDFPMSDPDKRPVGEGNGERDDRPAFMARFREWFADLKEVMRSRGMIALLVEAMSFEGITDLSKTYIQPLINNAAVALPLFLSMANKSAAKEDRTALLIGLVFVVINVLAAIASRKADKFEKSFPSPSASGNALWKISATLNVAAVGFLLLHWYYAVIALFVLQIVVQNIWRPILLTRLDIAGKATTDATVLSIESQAKSLFIAVFSVPVGLIVDRAGGELWPVATLCAGVGLVMLVVSKANRQREEAFLAAVDHAPVGSVDSEETTK